MILGLFIINEFGDYMDRAYPDLTTYITLFSVKWFSSIPLCCCLILLLSIGTARECFRGDADEVWGSIIGMLFPTYIFCVVIQ